MSLEKVTEYLVEKVSKVNVNNPKANSGAVLLRLNKNYEEDMLELVTIAFSIIQLHFSKESSSSPAGTAMLTAVSTLIGTHTSRRIQREPIPWKMQVRLGDLFIEAFYNSGLVDIYYPKARDTSYIISATRLWTDLAEIPEATARISLRGSSTTKPLNIDNILQESGKYSSAVIKGWTEQDNKRFTKDLDKPWIRAINKLQQTGWRINTDVYNAVIAHKDLFVSTDPVVDNDAKEMKRRSKLVEYSFSTSKAKLLLEEDVFYQYMEADYRGRLYYSEPFLNFQGPDITRGMLQFAKGKPMTEDGLFWLAVHTAASYNQSFKKDKIPEWVTSDYKAYLDEEGLEDISVDKMTLEDRVQWVNENMETIIEAGKEKVISMDAEKPVSFLACCVEWFLYQCSVDNNTMFMSHLPIPIDGSNNGWQHLGAISKDTHTGELVGLVPVDIQRDFYVQTAKELKKLTTDERLSSILSEMPMKKVRKGISKRGSMTRAYSAGAGKIAENMYFDCKTEDYHITYDITEDDCKKFAKTLIKAINTVCPGPLDTMAYLQALAKFEIGEHIRLGPDGKKAGKEYKELTEEVKELYFKKDKSEEDLTRLNELAKKRQEYKSTLVYGNGKSQITWTTPSGFFVEYKNYVMKSEKVIGTISGFTTNNKQAQIKHVAKVPTTIPDTRGFMCGISPNFIHSMDASHMAIVIDNWNNDFGAVHDSFSTHACDVEHLLELTKSVFINMYNVDNFYDYIENELISDKTNLDVGQPNRGSLNVEDIYQSDYFFA